MKSRPAGLIGFSEAGADADGALTAPKVMLTILKEARGKEARCQRGRKSWGLAIMLFEGIQPKGDRVKRAR